MQQVSSSHYKAVFGWGPLSRPSPWCVSVWECGPIPAFLPTLPAFQPIRVAGNRPHVHSPLPLSDVTAATRPSPSHIPRAPRIIRTHSSREIVANFAATLKVQWRERCIYLTCKIFVQGKKRLKQCNAINVKYLLLLPRNFYCDISYILWIPELLWISLTSIADSGRNK